MVLVPVFHAEEAERTQIGIPSERAWATLKSKINLLRARNFGIQISFWQQF
jgi:hypothetical protein